MKELTTDELKARVFKLLLEFRDLCDKNGLRYFITCGTLLGSVRHKGYIPWDDDIDVVMPRKDYDQFISLYKSSGRKNVLYCEATDDYNYPFAKLIDTDTVLIENDFDCGQKLGINLDIFPLDGLGKTYKQAKKVVKKIGFYHLLRSYRNMGNAPKSNALFKKLAKLILWNYSKLHNSKYWMVKTRRAASKYDFDDSYFVGAVMHSGQERRIMPKRVYGGTVKLEFENEYFNAPSDWNYFLTRFYGEDYMQIPPVDKQVSAHDFTAYLY